MRLKALPVIALFIVGCSDSVTAPTVHTMAEFETELDALRTQYHVPGVSAIIDGPGGTVWEHQYGYADVAQKTPVTSATQFHLASLTMPFASVIALQLVQ